MRKNTGGCSIPISLRRRHKAGSDWSVLHRLEAPLLTVRPTGLTEILRREIVEEWKYITPEQEAQLAQIATKTGTDAEHLVKDAVLRLLKDERSKVPPTSPPPNCRSGASGR
jgi:hypothetical protein